MYNVKTGEKYAKITISGTETVKFASRYNCFGVIGKNIKMSLESGVFTGDGVLDTADFGGSAVNTHYRNLDTVYLSGSGDVIVWAGDSPLDCPFNIGGKGGGSGDSTHFIGITTTAITDGATTNPITVNGESYTAVFGDIVIYNSSEFIFDGTTWSAFGGTMDNQPTQGSARAVTSDGVYRYTAGAKDYVNSELKGEIFNNYTGSGSDKNTASGNSSHAEGRKTTASGSCSHAEGYFTTASDSCAHVEGDNSTARGARAHAEGYATLAYSDNSHAEGDHTEARGAAAHAEGISTVASGAGSHAGGIGTKADRDYMTAIGQCNANPELGDLLHIGNGTDVNHRSSIVVVNGSSVNVNGDIKRNGNSIITEMSGIESDISDIEAFIGMDQPDVYGLCVDYENETNTRLANAVGKNGGADFNNIYPWNGMKRCTLADNGTVVAYYGDTGYVEDGSTGQCMVEVPKFYYKVVPLKVEAITETIEGTTITYPGYHLRKANYYISRYKKAAFKCHPWFIDPTNGKERAKAYIGAYEGSIYDVSESSYCLEDEQVIGNNSVSVDSIEDKFCSVAIQHTHTFEIGGVETEVTVHGVKPASGVEQDLTRPKVEKLCLNRGTNWHSFDTKAASALNMLFMVEYGTLNWQTAIGNGISAFASGTGNESSYTGSTASLGNTTGAAASTISAAGVAETTNGKVSVNYRGIENFYANIWKFMIDANVHGNGSLRGGIPYICTDYSYAESKNSGNYASAGFTMANAGGYISAFGYGDPEFDWLFMASETTGTSAKPVGDYTYVTANLNGYRIACLGGAWNYSSIAGGFFVAAFNGVGTRFRSLGGRLSYLPSGA